MAAVFGALLMAQAAAQSYPDKPIRLISPWPAGGPAEAIARPVFDKVAALLGQQVVIESKSGANGMIGTSFVATSAPDGYTLLLSHAGPTAISPALQKTMPYDPIRDFEHITLVAAPTIVLLVQPSLPIKTVPELIAYAKAHPGKLSYGSVGPGSTTHLAGEMLAMMADLKLVHVPYRGAAPVMTDMLGGQIDMAFIGNAAAAQHVQSGKLRAIAVASKTRASVAPDLPTVDATLKGFEVGSWYGLAAPAGTPAPIIDRIYGAVAKALADPDVLARLKKTGSDPGGMPPAEFKARIESDIAQWARVVKAAGIEKQ
ncbi:MAG: Bug family tripartite tricarboxylate transporter substrate binding protein [Lautropia sp.]